ncbi:MAG: sugar transferase, partial [Chitinophagaceae bacterium]
MLYLFIRDQQDFPRTVVSWFYAMFFFGILIVRYLFLILHDKFGFFESDKRRVAIIGSGSYAADAANFFKQPDSGYYFVGFFEDLKETIENEEDEQRTVEHYIEFALENDIQEIYSTILPASSTVLQKLVTEAERNLIRVKFIPDFNLLFYRNVSLSVEHGIPVISFRKEPLEDMKNRLRKKAFDLIFASLVTILLLSWLVPIIALIIKFTSRGPVFFIQKRSGRNGEEFNCFKFRTMFVNDLAN